MAAIFKLTTWGKNMNGCSGFDRNLSIKERQTVYIFENGCQHFTVMSNLGANFVWGGKCFTPIQSLRELFNTNKSCHCLKVNADRFKDYCVNRLSYTQGSVTAEIFTYLTIFLIIFLCLTFYFVTWDMQVLPCEEIKTTNSTTRNLLDGINATIDATDCRMKSKLSVSFLRKVCLFRPAK